MHCEIGVFLGIISNIYDRIVGWAVAHYNFFNNYIIYYQGVIYGKGKYYERIYKIYYE